MRVLVTGHTGFKGSWLIEVLSQRGHSLAGLSLPAEESTLFDQANLGRLLERDFRIDIRDRLATLNALKEFSPDFIIHMAAQSRVLEGWKDPLLTIETNLVGTLNLILAADGARVKNLLVVTSDKVYRRSKTSRPYIESDELGASDPYGASKAVADFATTALVLGHDSVVRPLVARAGNVFGGGDLAPDRLVPNLIESLNGDKPIRLRNPNHIRPWQHVLDCIFGYVLFMEKAAREPVPRELNFGPDPEDCVRVRDFISAFKRVTDKTFEIELENSESSIKLEEDWLLLDSTLARSTLGWTPLLGLEEAIGWTVDWYQNDPGKSISLQVSRFLSMVPN